MSDFDRFVDYVFYQIFIENLLDVPIQELLPNENYADFKMRYLSQKIIEDEVV